MASTEMTGGLVVGSARWCRLTTFAWSGAAVHTRVRLGLEGDRLYLSLPATSPAVERIWNRASVRIEPCTSLGRPTAPAVEAEARLLADDAAEAARRALAGVARDSDPVYVEVLSAAKAPAALA
jgi:PPOX class probable F420-dependent enzyme